MSRILFSAFAFGLLFSCTLASVDVCQSFPDGVIASNTENCTTEEVGFIRYNVTTDIAERCGSDLQWHVIGLGASGDASNLSPSQLQDKVYCTGHGTYNITTQSCECFQDPINGFHGGIQCDVCNNGMARLCNNRDYPCNVDIEAPVITLHGPSVVTILQYTSYVEEGASATDNVDEYVFPVTATFDLPFNASIPDTQYTITYTHTDAAGNAATPVVRTLVVQGLHDECDLDTHGCDSNAICTDTAWAYNCTCKYGYTGDGVTCSDFNECTVSNGGCHVNATCNNTAGGFSCSCDGGLEGDGINCAPVSVYCLRDFEDGHWALVRRVPQNSTTWGPWTDNAKGLVTVGAIDKDPVSLSTWTIPYGGYSYTNMLFTTGDYSHWVIVDRNVLVNQYRATTGCSNPHTVVKTGLNATSHVLGWCNRKATEDPWISERDHGYSSESAMHSMVYGEVKDHWPYYRTNNLGANVFIQSEQLCPQRVFCASSSFQGGGWALVRRSTHYTNTWGPWSDNAAGTEEEYGEYEGNPTADDSFSLKYSNFDFDEMMFATGDFEYWVRMNKTELLAGQVAGSGCNTTFQVTSSHVSPLLTSEVNMCNRASYGEDPWISARNFDYSSESAEHSMLYGENGSSDWSYYRENHFGANVFIRNFDLCPLS